MSDKDSEDKHFVSLEQTQEWQRQKNIINSTYRTISLRSVVIEQAVPEEIPNSYVQGVTGS